MPDDHQMFFFTEHILCIRHQFHAVFSFDADDICIIFDADIDVPDRMTDPLRQRGNFINGKIDDMSLNAVPNLKIDVN